MAGPHARPFHRPHSAGAEMTVTLVLGGARSGKSRHAESLAHGRKVYIATAEAFDDEMRDRIAKHRDQRGDGWETIEAPLELVSGLNSIRQGAHTVLIDCITVWLGNLTHRGRDIRTEVLVLCDTLKSVPFDVVVVSNEVGLSIVPENPMARAFRDEQGLANQRLAEVADNVVFVAAGLPLKLK
jgi:adenosylcobinamide kinase / adenosylcobinamide-phosphate guanylyltransferase